MYGISQNVMCNDMKIAVLFIYGMFCLQSLLEKKKTKSSLKFGQSRGGGMVISQKQGLILSSRMFILITL